MKNMKNLGTDGWGTGYALPVPAGAKNGNTIHLGNDLIGTLTTDRATTATMSRTGDGTAAEGLKDGEASVQLHGVGVALEHLAAVDFNQFQKVYVASDFTYTTVASGNKFIGWALYPALAGQKVYVGLSSN